MSLSNVCKIMTRWFEYPLREDSGCRHRAVQTLAVILFFLTSLFITTGRKY